ncbi:hypothetical protein BpHYR1_018551 [Brachionus plicatilis]|uniref:Uncharacterized protein n=1 Tax=Brachionus plicatilis TaxID=10195 RepID=A0A3M7P8W8_BRAPC|nr:hypothetical protein BpHYR1_018551 [Brachionus plicatilis]
MCHMSFSSLILVTCHCSQTKTSYRLKIFVLIDLFFLYIKQHNSLYLDNNQSLNNLVLTKLFLKFNINIFLNQQIKFQNCVQNAYNCRN